MKMHMQTVVAIGCLVFFAVPVIAQAEIPYRGTGTWTFNDSSGTTMVTGTLYDDHATATAEYSRPAPSGFHYAVKGNSDVCFICSIICSQLAGDDEAKNLMDITGGNYALTRTYRYSGYPNSGLAVTGAVTYDGDSLKSTATYIGEWDGPTNLEGITEWFHHLIPDGEGKMKESGRCKIFTTDDDTIVVSWIGNYTFDGELTVTQREDIDWTYQELSLDGTTLDLEWTGTARSDQRLTPSLTQWGTIALVLLLLAAGMMVIIRHRRLPVRA